MGEVEHKLKAGLHEELQPMRDEIAAMGRRLDKLPGWGGVATIVGAIFAAFTATFGILAFAGDRFDGGMSARGIMDAYLVEQRARDTRQDAVADEILRRLPAPDDRDRGRRLEAVR